MTSLDVGWALCRRVRACQANHARKLDLEAREFRTEIERAEFAAVDWVDEYESAIKRKDFLGRSALDHANRKCYFDIAKCVDACLQRYSPMDALRCCVFP